MISEFHKLHVELWDEVIEYYSHWYSIFFDFSIDKVKEKILIKMKKQLIKKAIRYLDLDTARHYSYLINKVIEQNNSCFACYVASKNRNERLDVCDYCPIKDWKVINTSTGICSCGSNNEYDKLYKFTRESETLNLIKRIKTRKNNKTIILKLCAAIRDKEWVE